MISKELLSEVLEEKVIIIEVLDSEAIFGEKQLWITSEKSFDCAVNTYELAHKCKEWVISLELRFYANIDSGFDDDQNEFNSWFCCIGRGWSKTKPFYANSEPEAIFKACQWILDNIHQSNQP